MSKDLEFILAILYENVFSNFENKVKILIK